jgi:hypothetical protein
MGYEISMKMKITGFNKPMIKISWDFHGDDCAHALHVTLVQWQLLLF